MPSIVSDVSAMEVLGRAPVIDHTLAESSQGEEAEGPGGDEDGDEREQAVPADFRAGLVVGFCGHDLPSL